MKKSILIIAVLMFCLTACSPGVTAIPEAVTATPKDVEISPTASIFTHPFPNHTAYAPGSILPNHRTQAQLDDDVRAFYDYWKASYVIQDGTDAMGRPFYQIAFGKNAEARANTVSEGQGFGMLILPVMAGYDPEAQEIFDGLWLFARSHPSEVDARLMDWNIVKKEGNASAFDGDADMALGLLLADAQWGS
ncbi:MAG: glycosyl hydrolase family 8, partial [Anaerolineaceae bacterium]|nr:glycosyl hydrolase family 8 [Anaerolineaceae bacterium]